MSSKSSKKKSFPRPIIFGILILLGILILGGSTLLSSNPSLPTIAIDTTLANTLTPYASNSTGATIYYPNGWRIREVPNERGFISYHIAPDSPTLDAMDIPQEGGILSLTLLTADMIGATPTSTATVASLLELQNQGMAEIPGATLTEPTQTFRIGAWEMARQVYRIEGTGDPYFSIQSLLKKGDTFVSASGFAFETQAATARPLFDAILSRVTVPPIGATE